MDIRRSKRRKLRELARKRQSSLPPQFKNGKCKNIGDYHQGKYECNFVSPYSKSAHNIDSEILILLQDLTSDEEIAGPLRPERVKHGRLRDLPTNQNLDRLLKKHFGLDISEIYATNLFPFIKPGKRDTKIPSREMRVAAREYALPHIQILRPMLVIVLGMDSFTAMAIETGHREYTKMKMDELIELPFLFGGSTIWCQAHTGKRGQMNCNREVHDQTDQDWAKMSEWFQSET